MYVAGQKRCAALDVSLDPFLEGGPHCLDSPWSVRACVDPSGRMITCRADGFLMTG